ncbi:MAG: RNA 2',3'-cyclic phosphodiesterase [Desulfurococcaceae archaeon]
MRREEFIRTFIAIEIREKETLGKLIAIRNALVETGADVKPVEDENIHITLRFIGEIPESMVRLICNEIAGISFSKFTAHVKGLGVFPNITRPRVVWAGIEEGSEKLIELHNLVEDKLRRLGIPREREGFTPHITLIRVKGHRNIDKLIKAINMYAGYDFGYFDVDEVIVKRSVLTPSGPIYSDLCSVKLS